MTAVHPSLLGLPVQTGAPVSQSAVSSANANQLKDTARNQLNQTVGRLVENQDAFIAALVALAAAINAKPSA